MKRRMIKNIAIAMALAISLSFIPNKMTNANAATNSGTITASTTEWTNKDVTISYNFNTTSRKGFASVTDPSNTYNYNFGWYRGTHEEGRTGTRQVATGSRDEFVRSCGFNNVILGPDEYSVFSNSPYPHLDIYRTVTTYKDETYTYYVTVANSYITVSSRTSTANKSFTVSGNGDYTATAKVYNDDLTTSSTSIADTLVKSIRVSNIDKLNPTIPTIALNKTSPSSTNTTFTVNASVDTLSGVKKYQYMIDPILENGEYKGTWLDYSSGVTVSTEGTHLIVARAMDNAGNYSSIATKQFTIDKTTPTVPTITLNNNNPTNGNVTFATSGSIDSLSGVNKYQYMIDPTLENGVYKGTWLDYSSGVTVSTEGKHLIVVRAIDKAGNYSNVGTKSFVIDKTKPTTATITLDNNELTNKNVAFSLDGSTDALSGVNKYQYMINPTFENGEYKGTWQDYSSGVTVSTEGEHLIAVRTIDGVGNYSDISTQSFIIDKTEPILEATNTPIGKNSVGKAIINILVNDTNFDYIILPNGEKTTENNVNYEVDADGTYSFVAVDKGGNQTVKNVDVIIPKYNIDNINAIFNQQDTIQLTTSSNQIDFNQVVAITHSDSHNPSTLVANVKSSLPYDVDINATDNFSNKEDATVRQIPISKLGVNIDGGAFAKFTGVNTPINLVSAAPATYTIGDNGQDYQIKFDLDSTVGYKAGNYQAPLTVTATQK